MSTTVATPETLALRELVAASTPSNRERFDDPGDVVEMAFQGAIRCIAVIGEAANRLSAEISPERPMVMCVVTCRRSLDRHPPPSASSGSSAAAASENSGVSAVAHLGSETESVCQVTSRSVIE